MPIGSDSQPRNPAPPSAMPRSAPPSAAGARPTRPQQRIPDEARTEVLGDTTLPGSGRMPGRDPVPAHRYKEHLWVVAPCGEAGPDSTYKPVCAGSRPDFTALTSAS
jgi:hypothetical protein